VFLQQQALGAAYDDFKAWDVGDMIGARAPVPHQDRRAVGARVERCVLLTKSLRPLPDKWHGIADTELRYRRATSI
jgi:lysyl-tRNA synthetase class 2